MPLHQLRNVSGVASCRYGPSGRRCRPIMALASAIALSVMRPSAGAEPTSEEVAVVLKVKVSGGQIMHNAFYGKADWRVDGFRWVSNLGLRLWGSAARTFHGGA